MKRNVAILAAFVLFLVGCGNSQLNFPTESVQTSVQDDEITVTAVYDKDTLEIDGKYTGEMLDGKPQGMGVFTTETDDGTIYMYEGEFLDGSYDGHGTTTIKSGDETIEITGTYTKGEFTPTVGEAFNYIGQLDLFGKFSIPETVIEYIDADTSVFPIATDEAIQETDVQDFSFKQFRKTRKQDQIGLVKLDLYAVQVFEDDYLDGKLTYLLAVDDDANYYALYYLDSAEVYDEDAFTVYAVPCTASSFDNISGGTTNVIVMAACYIE